MLKKHDSGFTLLEALLAIGILSVVCVQIISVQASSLAVTVTTRDAMSATWALRSATSQIEYVLDSLGADGLPKERVYPWPADEKYKISILTKETNLEASKLLFTALKLGSGAAIAGEEKSGGGEENDPAKGMKEIGEMLDSQIPKDMYKTLTLNVSWAEGEATKSIDGGMLVIDDSKIKIQIPGLSGLGGEGAEAPGGGSQSTATDGTGKPPITKPSVKPSPIPD